MSCSGTLAMDSANPNSALPVAPAECPGSGSVLVTVCFLLCLAFSAAALHSAGQFNCPLSPCHSQNRPLQCPHQLTSAPLARGLSTREAANRNPLQSCGPHSLGLLPSILGSSDPCLPLCPLSPRDRSNILQFLPPLVTSVPLSSQSFHLLNQVLILKGK